MSDSVETGPSQIAFDEWLALGLEPPDLDYSRTWLVGDGPASSEQLALFSHARDHLDSNIALMQPGSSYAAITAAAHRLAPVFRAQRYSMIAHGLGLCDEFPCIRCPENVESHGRDGVLEPGMILSVEAYVGAVGGKQGVKLEDMVVITPDGNERMSHYPFDPALSG